MNGNSTVATIIFRTYLRKHFKKTDSRCTIDFDLPFINNNNYYCDQGFFLDVLIMETNSALNVEAILVSLQECQNFGIAHRNTNYKGQ